MYNFTKEELLLISELINNNTEKKENFNLLNNKINNILSGGIPDFSINYGPRVSLCEINTDDYINVDKENNFDHEKLIDERLQMLSLVSQSDILWDFFNDFIPANKNKKFEVIYSFGVKLKEITNN